MSDPRKNTRDIFPATGTELTTNDDDDASYDSFARYTATTSGTYYVGVTSFGNEFYDPTQPGSGLNRSTGSYELGLAIDAPDPGLAHHPQTGRFQPHSSADQRTRSRARLRSGGQVPVRTIPLCSARRDCTGGAKGNPRTSSPARA